MKRSRKLVKTHTGGGQKNKVSLMWKIRTGLGPPHVSLRAITSFCKDFGMEPTQAISYDTVSRVRHAFADLIKQRNKEELANRASQAVAIVMSHVHDEATMKVRSYIHRGPVPIRVHVAAPGNGKFVLFARSLVSSGFACARALSGLYPSL